MSKDERFIRPTFKQNLLYILKECELISKTSTEKDAIEYISKQPDLENQLLRYFVNILNNLFFLRGLTYDDIQISNTHKNNNMFFIISKHKEKRLAVIYNMSAGF